MKQDQIWLKQLELSYPIVGQHLKMTRRYLQRKADGSFFLFLLGVPVLIWIYSITVELNKRLPEEKRLDLRIFYATGGTAVILQLLLLFRVIDPFQFSWLGEIAMVLGLTTIGFTAFLITRFEDYIEIQPTSGLLFFIQLWIAPIGVFYLQPLLNDYILYPEINQVNEPNIS